MRTLKFILPALVVMGGVAISSTVAYGSVATSKKEGAKCTVCHTQGKTLNKVGECYKTSKDLKACQAK